MWEHGGEVTAILREIKQLLVCDNCDAELDENDYLSTTVYQRPFSDERTEYRYCCDECEQHDLYERDDFRYFTCGSCQRIVCEQNPSNGYHVQYREVDGAQICLRCYEKHVLENGLPRESFEETKISGTFFSSGNIEPVEAGYSAVDGYQDYRICGQESITAYCNKALSLIDTGHRVITAYEKLGYGGGEGYVSLYAKKISDGRQFISGRVWWLDVLGSAKDGWQVNDRREAGTIRVPKDFKDEELLDAFHKAGIFSHSVKLSQVKIEDDNYPTVYINKKRGGRPCYEIEFDDPQA